MSLDDKKWIKYGDEYYQIKPDMFNMRRVATIVDFGATKYIKKVNEKDLPEVVREKIPPEYLGKPIRAKVKKERKRPKPWTWGHKDKK